MNGMCSRPRLNSFGRKRCHNPVPPGPTTLQDTDDIGLKAMPRQISASRKPDGIVARHQLRIAVTETTTFRQKAIQLGHLRYADCSLNVGQSQIESQIVERRHRPWTVFLDTRVGQRGCTMIALRTNKCRQIVTICGDGPAFAGCHCLARVKRKTADVADPPYRVRSCKSFRSRRRRLQSRPGRAFSQSERISSMGAASPNR